MGKTSFKAKIRIISLALIVLTAVLPLTAYAAGGGFIGAASDGSVEVYEQFAVSGTGSHRVTASVLNVRSGPGTGYGVIGRLYQGTLVQVLSINGTFCRIQSTTGTAGYVSRDYLTPVAAVITPAPTYAPQPTATPYSGGSYAVYRITASALNVRSGPSTGYGVLTRVYMGEYVYKINDVSADWMRIRLQNGQYGYIMSKYAVYAYTPGGTASPTATPRPTARPTATPAPTAASDGDVYQVTTNLNLRSGPGLGYGIKGVLISGARVTLISRYSADWYYIKTSSNIYGYVKSSYLVFLYRAQPTPTPTPVPTVVNTTQQLYSYKQMMADIDALHKAYPDMVTRVVSIGNTMWNQQIPAVCVGNPNASKALLIDAGIHGREYMSTLLVMKQMEYLLENQNAVYNGETIKSMLTKCCVWFIPMINPDGVQISQNGLTGLNSTQKNNLIAMNGGSTYFARWKANGYGVDLNRNFESGWTYTGTPSYADYSGSYANSESETQAMINFVRNHTTIKASINYHTVGNCIYWHYGQTGAQRTRDKQIADRLSALTGYYLKGENYTGVGGGFMDWMIASRGLPSFTIELGQENVAAPQSISYFNSIWSANRDVVQEMLYLVVSW